MYRVFNDFYLTKNQKDVKERRYLHDMFYRVLDDIEYTSDNEKLAMHNIASNWANAYKMKSQRVYGKVKKFETVSDEVSFRAVTGFENQKTKKKNE